MLIIVMLALMVASPVAQATPAPHVPTPPFAADLRVPPKTPYQMEVSFRPSVGHDLEEVRTFYLNWAKDQKWRQVSGKEESWSRDEWFSYINQEGRELRQRFSHWVDPTGQWSVRLVLRSYPATREERAYVLLMPFHNLDKVQ